LNDFLPFALPLIGDDEITEVVDTLKSGWLTTGKKTVAFERQFEEYVDASNALSVNSATSGLHLALEAIGVGPGDAVVKWWGRFLILLCIVFMSQKRLQQAKVE